MRAIEAYIGQLVHIPGNDRSLSRITEIRECYDGRAEAWIKAVAVDGSGANATLGAHAWESYAKAQP